MTVAVESGTVAESLAIDAGAREPLLAEIDRFAASVRSDAGRERYTRLRAAVEEGAVSAELAPVLEDLLRIALGSRSVHHFHGPGPERALRDLYARTPGGAAVEAAARAANRALEAVRGQTVQSLAFRPGLPGEHRLVVETDRCRITLEITPDGVSARDVQL